MTETSLFDLSARYDVGDDRVEGFQRDGHVLLRGVASAQEVAGFRDVIRSAVQRLSSERRPLSERDTYGKAFLQVPNLWVHDRGVRGFVLADRFAAIAARLLRVD